MSAVAALLAMAALAVAGRPRRSRVDAAPAPRVRPLSRRAQRRVVDRAMPHALELVVLAVRAGHLPVAALDAAAAHVAEPVAHAFRDVVQRVVAGERFADATCALTGHLGPVAAPLADSLASADRYGLPLAPVLERLADEARQRRRRHADAMARQLPVRLSVPLVVCTLPSFVLLAVVPLLLAALSSLQR